MNRTTYSLVVGVLDQQPRGRGFECRWLRAATATVGQLLFAPWACGLTQPSILLGSINEYRLRLGRYKAGMYDAAWCVPCTGAPLRCQCLLGAL